MANVFGLKWNRGGAKRRKNYISIDFSNFAEYAEKLDRLNADLKKIFGDAMEDAAKQVQEDTRKAVDNANLPAGGNYSDGETKASIIRDVTPKWSGSLGEVKLGFDKTKPGAGGFLITGLRRWPRMLYWLRCTQAGSIRGRSRRILSRACRRNWTSWEVESDGRCSYRTP